MSFNAWIRQVHRWLSIAFTIGVIINTAVIFGLKVAQPPYWVYLLALVPLFALLFTGLYLFALPYLARRPRAERARA